MNIPPSIAHTVVRVIDCSLQGSEYAMQAWKLVRLRLSQDKLFSLQDLQTLEDLLDRAEDDVASPIELTVDLSRERLYG